jgi:hypothetical protein
MSPRKVDAHLRALLHHLGLQDSAPVLLKYTRPTSFVPEQANCHLNTWCQLRAHGGDAVHGWVLAQDKAQMFSEAIFHTVWRSAEGKLVDVTPRPDAEKRVMFVPDPSRAIVLTDDEGRPAIDTYNNVRLSGANLVTPVQPIRVVMQSSFAERQGLWPW